MFLFKMYSFRIYLNLKVGVLYIMDVFHFFFIFINEDYWCMVGTFYTKYMYKTFKKVTVDHFSYNLASLK